MAADVTPAQYRELLADLFTQTAQWRREKAELYPDDVRNVNCATALEAAAEYVRGLPDDYRSLQPFLEFDRQIYAWRGLAPIELFVSSSDAAARFRFDRANVAPTPRDFDVLTARIYAELLEGWREAIQDGEQPPASLARLFDEHGVPLWDDDEDSGDDDDR
jgi:hypothetical protein